MKLEQRYQQHQSVHNSLLHNGFLKWGIPKTMGFNTKMVYIILDDLGYPNFRNLHLVKYTCVE